MKAESLGLLTIALAACSTGNQPTGHTTTLPPLPTCLVFCFAHIESTVEARSTNVPSVKKKAPAPAPAPAIPPPPPVQKPPPVLDVPRP